MTIKRALFLALVLLPLAGCASGPNLPRIHPVGEFKLTDRSGKTVTQEDLKGKVWIASFVFVRCTSHCPQITAAVRQLQSDLRDVSEVRFVTFTVDPTHDREAELREYAEKFQADADRWYFLTGEEAEINRLLTEQFQVGSAKPGDNPGDLMHSTRLVLIDREGVIRGYYDGMAPAAMLEFEGPEAAKQHEEAERTRLVTAVKGMAHSGFDFPLFHAILNSVATLLLILGGLAIKARAIRLHIVCMVTTLAISAVFLASYLNYHLVIKGSVATRFQDWNPEAPDSIRYLYYGILLSHTVLAIVITPLALRTAYLGWKGDYTRHRPLARWVLPVWLYVTATGVVVYWMLYRMYAPA